MLAYVPSRWPRVFTAIGVGAFGLVVGYSMLVDSSAQVISAEIDERISRISIQLEALQLADPEKASRVQAEILALRDQANQLLESRYTRIVDAIDGAINPVLQSALGFALLFMCYVVGEMLLLLTSLLFRSKAFRSESATRLARIAASDNQMVQMSAEKSQAAIELAYAVLALTLLLSVWLLHRSDNLLSAPLALLPVLGALLFSCWFVKSMASEIDQELEAFETLAKAPQ